MTKVPVRNLQLTWESRTVTYNSPEIGEDRLTVAIAKIPPSSRLDDASEPGNKRRLFFGLLLVVLTLAFYNPVAHNGFVFFDDSPYILKNPQIQNGLTWETVKWASSTFYSANWHPLTWLSHALDLQLFGLNPGGHHYVSLLFHAANVVLLFLLLENATRLSWPSLIVAALFAVHPLNVESVAWAAERKNVLSMFFALLAFYAYTRFTQGNKAPWYVLSIVTFAFGLMAKPQIVPIPFLLLLWDYWPLGRIASPDKGSSAKFSRPLKFLLLEKVPFFMLAVASCAITMLAQRAGSAVRTVAEVSVAARTENSIVSYARYLSQVFWPVRLAPLYPHPGNSLPFWKIGLSLSVLLLATALAIYRKDRPYLLTGWLWFLGSLIPTIGLIQVGEQAMADRYMYLPLAGILIAVVWLAMDLASAMNLARSFLVGSAFAILALGFLTYRQLGHWHDGETLWRYTLSVTPPNYMAHDNLAMVLAEEGKADEAISEFRAAEALHNYPAPQILTLGAYEQRNGHLQGAIEQYDRALRTTPDPAVKVAAWNQLASAYAQEKDWDRAKLAYDNALGISPSDVNALIGSGLLAERSGDLGLAVHRLSRAVEVSPSDIGLLLLAGALREDGKDSDGAAAYAKAKSRSADFDQAQVVARQIANSFGVMLH